jgi:SsrA-binding protein
MRCGLFYLAIVGYKTYQPRGVVSYASRLRALLCCGYCNSENLWLNEVEGYMAKQTRPQQPSIVNRKAFHDYEIEEEYEAGLMLTGSEIKSIRAGRVNLRGAYARVEDGEVWLFDTHISPYEQTGTYFQHDPTRPRKLLLHRREINRLLGKLEQKGLTLVPLDIHFKNRRAKVRLGLARGKKLYDKRAATAERESQRQIERALKSRRYEE